MAAAYPIVCAGGYPNLTQRGEWSPNAKYNAGSNARNLVTPPQRDVVTSGGKEWAAWVPSVGVQPPNPAYWARFFLLYRTDNLLDPSSGSLRGHWNWAMDSVILPDDIDIFQSPTLKAPDVVAALRVATIRNSGVISDFDTGITQSFIIDSGISGSSNFLTSAYDTAGVGFYDANGTVYSAKFFRWSPLTPRGSQAGLPSDIPVLIAEAASVDAYAPDTMQRLEAGFGMRTSGNGSYALPNYPPTQARVDLILRPSGPLPEFQAGNIRRGVRRRK